VKILRYTKTIVITPQEAYDLNDDRDRDRFERELMRGNEFLEYTKKIQWAGRIQSVRAGNFIGNTAPYGYKKKAIKDGKRTCHTLEPVPEKAATVKRIFEMYASGLGVGSIAKQLDAEHIPAPKEKGWSPESTNVTSDTDCYAQFRSTAVVSRKLVDRTISGDYTNDRVTSVGNYAFSSCSQLTTVDFPAVTSIGSNAFSSCVQLNTLILRNAAQVCTLSSTLAFNSTPIASGTGCIYVPRTLVDGSDGVAAYQAATNWSTYAAQFRAIEDYPDICGG
jgi:hypothetical protein